MFILFLVAHCFREINILLKLFSLHCASYIVKIDQVLWQVWCRDGCDSYPICNISGDNSNDAFGKAKPLEAVL